MPRLRLAEDVCVAEPIVLADAERRVSEAAIGAPDVGNTSVHPSSLAGTKRKSSAPPQTLAERLNVRTPAVLCPLCQLRSVQ